MITLDSTGRMWYDSPVGMLRPRPAFALHESGSTETPLGCSGAEADSPIRLFSDAAPAHPKGVLHVRPLGVVGIQTTGRSVYCGQCWAPKAAANANPTEAGSHDKRQWRMMVGHGAGSLIKVGPWDTKGVCADDGVTLPVRILSALRRHGHHLTAAPDDCDGWLRQARSHDSEHHLADSPWGGALMPALTPPVGMIPMKTLRQHLKAMSELETVGQYADYLYWQPGTPQMQRALLEYVPSRIRGSVWSGVMSRYHEQRTGQPHNRGEIR